MTVHELIEELQKIPNQNMPAYLEYEQEYDDGDGYMESYPICSEVCNCYIDESMEQPRVIIL